MHSVGVRIQSDKFQRSWHTAETRFPGGVAVPCPEASLPCRQPQRERAIHLRLLLKKGEVRGMQKRLENWVIAAGSRVAAK